MSAIKGIIFDYGGTLDNCGDHWAVVIREAYACLPLHELPLELFCKAYVYAERELAAKQYVKPDYDFRSLMLVKGRLELEELRRLSVGVDDDDIQRFAGIIADYTDAHARECIDSARPVLDYLSERYKLALVSNFYGNLETVLRTYNLLHYFPIVIESAAVGVRKPDPAIFRLGVDALGCRPEEVLVVGDSVSKDILPARSIGCETLRICGRPWFYEKGGETPGKCIKNLEEIPLLY